MFFFFFWYGCCVGVYCCVEGAQLRWVGVGKGLYIGGEKLVSGDDVRAVVQHTLGKTSGIEALGLEIFHHGPGTPATHELGVDGVNTGADEGYTAPIPEGSDGYIFGGQSKDR